MQRAATPLAVRCFFLQVHMPGKDKAFPKAEESGIQEKTTRPKEQHTAEPEKPLCGAPPETVRCMCHRSALRLPMQRTAQGHAAHCTSQDRKAIRVQEDSLGAFKG